MSGPKILKLDFLRAVSAAIVIMYHSGIDWIPADFGVLVFFVISGFLITWLLLREDDASGTVSLKNFYIRRSLRIFPAFYAYWLLVVLAHILAVHLRHRPSPFNWPQAICSAFYVTNYYNGLHGYPSSGLSHTWSLAVEEQFYLLWPWLFVALRQKRKTLIYVLLVLIPGLWLYRAALALHGVSEAYLYTAFETRADAILIGCLLALVLATDWARKLDLVGQKKYLVLTVAALAFSLYGERSLGYRDTVGLAVDALLVGTLILQLTRVRGWSWMDSRPISYLSRISYSTYLYQQVIHPIVSRAVPGRWAVLVCLPAVWLVASVSYGAIEKPVLRLKERFRTTGDSPATPHQAAERSPAAS